jgi:bifunctional non-homologous end joining protein LigD
LHVLVPLAPGHTHDDAVEFAVKVGETLASALPQITLERAKKKRRGRLYFDCDQNGYGKTVVAPYSLRGSPGAPVSAPLKWSEVSDKLDPASFNIETMKKRLDKLGDLFRLVLEGGVRLPRFR